jgi:hypothetical protein
MPVEDWSCAACSRIFRINVASIALIGTFAAGVSAVSAVSAVLVVFVAPSPASPVGIRIPGATQAVSVPARTSIDITRPLAKRTRVTFLFGLNIFEKSRCLGFDSRQREASLCTPNLQLQPSDRLDGIHKWVLADTRSRSSLDQHALR